MVKSHHADIQVGLKQSADDAESKFQEMDKRLTTLKKSVHQFAASIFGKSVLLPYIFIFVPYEPANSVVSGIGKQHLILQESPDKKLTSLYILIKQLCEGAVKSITAAQGKPVTTSKMTEMMQSFSTVPAWVNLAKRSACRLGVMRGLELSKAYHPDMKPELLVDGFPELKADGSDFTETDYINIVKEMRIFATKIADEVDLSEF